jgi:N4-gp56 family major capsid protein
MIDSAVESAKTLDPMIRPIKLKGEDKYVMFFHPFQVFNLRTSSSTGQWLDIQKAAVQGHGKYDSPIYTGAMGEYNGVVIHESSRVPKGHTSGTENASVRRAIFCGAQAGHIAFGQGHAPSKYSWVEELFDYNNQLGVSAGCISGLKKAIFNGKDFGTIASSSFAVAH